MHPAVRLSPGSRPKMSACGDFVEHIWKPGSCKNCFCLRGDHQLSPPFPQPGAGGPLPPPPPRLPPRPELCRPEDEGVSGSPYSKPTIAVKPTMLSPDAADVWTEAAALSPDASQVWRRAAGQLPLPKQEDAPMVRLGSFRGAPKPAAPADGRPRRPPPAYAAVGLQGPAARGERSAAFRPPAFPEDKATWAGREEKPACPRPGPPAAAAPESCPQKPAARPSARPPREALPAAEDAGGRRRSPSGDSEGGEYCSILDCCPGSPAAAARAEGPRHRPGGGARSPACWEQGACVGPAAGGAVGQALGFPAECCGQGPAEEPPPHPGPRRPSPPSDNGLPCGSGASSPCAPHPGSDCCSLAKEPVPGGQQDAGCHAEAASGCLGPAGEPQPPTHPRENLQPEPIYAESTKRKKALPVPSRPQGKAEQPAAGHGHGQGRTVSAWTQKTACGWSRDREGGPDVAPKVAATITIMAAYPKEDHRTIYLSSPDSAVGVQWLGQPASQDPGAGDPETSAGQGKGSRDGHPPDAGQNVPQGRPAIPPKLSRGSPGGSPS